MRAPIKAFLLDQTRVAGLGNIYVCEALFGARIHPTTPAGRVRRRAPALLAAVRETLEGGIARRGTTLRDYVDADGFAGDNAAALQVYGREGEACVSCGAAIRRRVDAGRSNLLLRPASGSRAPGGLTRVERWHACRSEPRCGRSSRRHVPPAEASAEGRFGETRAQARSACRSERGGPLR